ncbi:MAG: transposase [Thermoanaerobaculia bacterium]
MPHWDCDPGIYAITFNLFDAVPADRLTRLRHEAELQRERIRAARGRPSFAEEAAIERALRRKIFDLMDQGHGSSFMMDPEIARLVVQDITADAIELFAWCVMPNHVHVVAPSTGPVAVMVKRWKGRSARDANQYMNRAGQSFWQQDYFDRSIRDPRELRAWMGYVEANPRRAGLRDWPWVAVDWERAAPYLMVEPLRT